MKWFILGLSVLLGSGLGIYLGGYLCFVGGIVDVVESVRATELVGLDLAIGIVKVMAAAPVGYLSAMLFIVPVADYVVQDGWDEYRNN